ncbi:MAG: clan AA aspartic protease [Akkermansiaceae bacterium]|nr:clan AA aspartic protease [Armatimonadota bacterium]
MEGVVRKLQAVIGIPFSILGRPDIVIEFVVDTGFSGELLLPKEAVEILGLPYQIDVMSTLADGVSRRVALHKATISWNGELLDVGVLATGNRPLLGTALLADHRLEIEFDEDSIVHVY